MFGQSTGTFKLWYRFVIVKGIPTDPRGTWKLFIFSGFQCLVCLIYATGLSFWISGHMFAVNLSNFRHFKINISDFPNLDVKPKFIADKLSSSVITKMLIITKCLANQQVHLSFDTDLSLSREFQQIQEVLESYLFFRGSNVLFALFMQLACRFELVVTCSL